MITLELGSFELHLYCQSLRCNVLCTPCVKLSNLGCGCHRILYSFHADPSLWADTAP